MDFQAYYDRKFAQIYTVYGEEAFRHELENSLAYYRQTLGRVGNLPTLPDAGLEFGASGILVFPHLREYEIAPYHKHEFYEFIYVGQGHCMTMIDETSIELGQGDLCLMNMQASHSLQLSDPPNDLVFNILIRKDAFDQAFFLMMQQGNPLTDFFLSSLQNRRMRDNYLLFRREDAYCPYDLLIEQILMEELEMDAFRERMLTHLFRALLINLARNDAHQIELESASDLGSRYISQIILYIADHCDTITITTLATNFNYSKNHLSALIKKYSGRSFSEILQDIRFQKAAQLLQQTHLPIAEIMEMVGCTNRTWFNQKFCSRYGMSPSAYQSKK